MTDATPKPINIARHLDAVYSSFALLAGMQLDLFTPLDGGPLNAGQLAAELGVGAAKLTPLLNALVVAGLLTREGDVYANTPEANHYLVSGKPNSLIATADLTANNWARVFATADTVRAGGALAEYDFESSQGELLDLFRGLHPRAMLDGQRLMDQHDFSAHRSLLDVGGGSGGLAIAIAQANPQLTATVLEFPSITPLTQQFIDEADAGERVKTLAGDAVRETLSGAYDVAVARHVIQVLSEVEARALLKNVAAVVRPGGVIHLLGWILDDSRLTPENTVGYNLILMNVYPDGEAYTEAQYFAWLEEVGFTDMQRVTRLDGTSTLTARKSG